MKKGIVYFYSNTNNNRYLANKIAKELEFDIEEIKPRCKFMPYLIFSTLTRVSLGIKPIKNRPNKYENIVVCGPIWMGSFISPLRDFVKKNKKGIKKLFFITCCGSSHEEKNSKFGYAGVFKQVKNIMGKNFVDAQALPISLVFDKKQKKNSQEVMKTKLSDENFKGEIKNQFSEFIKKIK
jgi:flavodoxin